MDIKSHITTHIYLKITKRENILMQQNLCYFREDFTIYFIYFIYFIWKDSEYHSWFQDISTLDKTNTPLHTNTSTSQVQHASC